MRNLVKSLVVTFRTANPCIAARRFPHGPSARLIEGGGLRRRPGSGALARFGPEVRRFRRGAGLLDPVVPSYMLGESGVPKRFSAGKCYTVLHTPPLAAAFHACLAKCRPEGHTSA